VTRAAAFASLLAHASDSSLLRVAFLHLRMQQCAVGLVASDEDFLSFFDVVKERLSGWSSSEPLLALCAYPRHATLCSAAEAEWLASRPHISELTCAEFKAAIANPACLLYLPSVDQSLKNMLETLISAHAVDNTFFHHLVASGTAGVLQLRRLYAVLDALLFASDGVVLTEEAAQLLVEHAPTFPVIVLKELHAVVCNAGSPIEAGERRALLCGLAALALRFDDALAADSGHGVSRISLSLWVQLHSGDVQLMRDVFSSLSFDTFLAARFTDASGETSDGYALPQVGWLGRNVRGGAELPELFSSYAKLTILVDSNLLARALERMPSWMARLLPARAPLRDRLVNFILSLHAFQDIDGGFVEAMHEARILNHPMHFSDTVLKAMCLPAQLAHAADDKRAIQQLIELGLFFGQFSGSQLIDDVRTLFKQMKSVPTTIASSPLEASSRNSALKSPSTTRPAVVRSFSRRGLSLRWLMKRKEALTDENPEVLSEAPAAAPAEALDDVPMQASVDSLAEMPSVSATSPSQLCLILDLIFQGITLRKETESTVFFDAQTAAALIDLKVVLDCARSGADAMLVLLNPESPLPKSAEKLGGLFRSIVQREPPDKWQGLFGNTTRIASFLKYLDRESYAQCGAPPSVLTVTLPSDSWTVTFACRAVAAFRSDNTDVGRVDSDRNLFSMIVEPVCGPGGIYTKPLFTLKAEQLSDDAAVQAFIDELRLRGAANLLPVLGMLELVTAEWMRITKIKIRQAMPPRNCQIISTLLSSEWINMRLAGKVPRSQMALITKVGTGEGKAREARGPFVHLAHF
jgi:hypothetical protein